MLVYNGLLSTQCWSGLLPGAATTASFMYLSTWVMSNENAAGSQPWVVKAEEEGEEESLMCSNRERVGEMRRQRSRRERGRMVGGADRVGGLGSGE